MTRFLSNSPSIKPLSISRPFSNEFKSPIPNYSHPSFQNKPEIVLKPKMPSFVYFGTPSPVSCVTLAILGGSIHETPENNGVNNFIPYIGFSVTKTFLLPISLIKN